MPTYAQIQTYVTCTPTILGDVLQRYGDALTRLGCHDPRVHAWLSTISWPLAEDDPFGDIYAAPLTLAPAEDAKLQCAGIEASLYTRPGIPTLEDPPAWLGLNILLDLARLRAHVTAAYKKDIGYTIWLILCELSQNFTELGAYFTDPWQENMAWRAIVEGTGDPWAFELGIFPRKLAMHFEEVPPGYQGTVLDGAFGFAQTNHWQTLPWEEEP